MPPNGRTGRATTAAAIMGPPALALLWTLSCHPPSRFAAFENTFLRTLLLILPVALFLGRSELLRMAGAPTRVHALVLVAVVGLGALLRFSATCLPYHASNWLEDLVGRVAKEPQPDWYANGFGVFMRLFLPFTPTAESALFLGNRIAGVLAPAALYAAGRALFAGSSRALWAAALLAALPLHVRLSASESMQIIPTLFLLLAVVGLRGHARFGSRPLLAVGLAAFWFAVLTRPEWSVTAVALPLVYATPEGRARLRDGFLWLGAAIGVGIGVPLVRVGASDHSLPIRSIPYVAKTFHEALTLAGPPHTSWAIAGAAGFVIAFGTAGRARGVTLLPVILLAAMLLVAGFDRNPANELQLLCAEFPWILLGTGCALATAVEWAARAGPVTERLAAAGLAAAAALQVAQASFFQLVLDKHEEFLFLERVMPSINALPIAIPVVRENRGDFSDGELPSLPFYMLRPNAIDYTFSAFLSRPVPLPVIYYRGLGCYHQVLRGGPAPSAPTPGGLTPTCVDLESRFRLRPIEVTSFDARTIGSTALQHFEIGFYWLDDPSRR